MSEKTITRNCVSENFRLYAHGSKTYLDKRQLCETIDRWKVVFAGKFQLTRGNVIGLGLPLTDITYFGALLAACELGLKLPVMDRFFDHLFAQSHSNKFWQMDLFLGNPGLSEQHLNRHKSIIGVYDDYINWRNYVPTDSESQYKADILAQESDQLLLCTSSGTTDTPKRIRHTHKFLYEISARNQQVLKFNGNVLHLRNLHHGSSLAVYFLPTLMSDSVTSHHTCNFNPGNLGNPATMARIIDYLVAHDINHIQFPYTDSLGDFLKQSAESKIKFNDLTLHTLSYIKPEWLPMIEACNIRQIISIFGSNETSGPVFVSSLSPGQTDFKINEFRLLDDFYNVSLNENNQLVVNLATYNQTVTMQDHFEQQNGKFIHHGRSDLTRINDIDIELFYILDLCDKHNINGQCTVDKQYERIYLALWEDNPNAMDVLNRELSAKYNPTIKIYRDMRLNKLDYMSGIKLDHDLIRETFRNEK